MKRHELLGLIAVAITLITAGLTWCFGPYALVGSGAVLLVASPFIKRRGD